MAKGRMGPEKVRSWQAATLIALLANVHRDPRKSRKYRAEDFDPYDAKPRRQAGVKVTAENWDWFVKAFTPRASQRSAATTLRSTSSQSSKGGRRCSG